eukprot:TRINITY_DN146_c0_g1_i1.p1 TRINITY_DN146_c0_g1~~TRINITY_DN146_c0_g1_i1.p1  ORF type:complete len:207 (-),score=68.43 TRINITY_DN146_c0_g1_i1:211-831(-)
MAMFLRAAQQGVRARVAPRQNAFAFAAARSFANADKVKIGGAAPDAEVYAGFPPEKLSFKSMIAGKKVILMGLPGAFTPTCSTKNVPGYLAKQDELKAKGVDEIIVFCCDNSAVMKGWAKDQGIEGTMMKFIADTHFNLTDALGVEIVDEGVKHVLGRKANQRFTMLIDNGIIKAINVAASPTDLTGDGNPTVSFVEQMLKDLDAN